MRSKRFLTSLPIGCACALLAAPARADVSSWVFVGGGPVWLKTVDLPSEARGSLLMQAGFGTPPSGLVEVGGLLSTDTFFGRGTDLMLTLRTATRGFTNGGWGAALDLGPYRRWWGARSTGGYGALVLGAPWGITASAGGRIGSGSAEDFQVVLGIDFARLTVHREAGLSWFPNPFPAGESGPERP
jgi:hypothetical protein